MRSYSRGRPIIHKETVLRPSTQPLIKWAGGKQWLALAAPQLVPSNWCGRYYEPFFGGGAFFFALEPKKATLSDLNQELIETYRAVRADSEGVIRLLNTYPYDKNFYYKLRNRSPRNSRSIAARFLYMNRTCWNSLYRVNREGKFNTPFGKYNNPTICDRLRIRSAAKLLRRAQLRVGDFKSITYDALPGDFVYFDPPYITGHQNNGFLKYNSKLFSWSDQEQLSKYAIQLSNKGVYVLVSNADHPAVIELYKGLKYYTVSRRSLIGGQVASRGVINEALLSNYALLGCDSEVI